MKLLLVLREEINSCSNSLIRRFAMLVFVCTAGVISLNAQMNKPFSIRSVVAQPGEKASGMLIVEDAIDKGTIIPITIINGKKPGPVLTVFAGVHGTEFVPVIVLQQLAKEIDPEELSGTLVLVHIANVPSFSRRSIYLNPDDKNLNRIFPGKEDGTITERIAWVLANELIIGSDYFIDTHGGEYNEQVLDFVYYYYGCPDKELCKGSYMLAKTIGNKYLIPYKYPPDDGSPAVAYSDMIAIRHGIPTITLEWSDMGMVEPEKVLFAKKGLKNVMRAVGMLPGEAAWHENQVYLLDEISVTSKSSGILYSFVKRGEYVTKGSLIAYVTDYFGNLLEEYRSPADGIIVTILVSPAINKDNKIYSIARPVSSFDN